MERNDDIMGWIFCITFMIGYVFNSDPIWLLAAGLFAISGGLSEVGSAVRRLFIFEDNKEEE